MIWGGVPTDIDFVRNSNLFKEGLKRFENGEFDKFLNKKTPAQLSWFRASPLQGGGRWFKSISGYKKIIMKYLIYNSKPQNILCSVADEVGIEKKDGYFILTAQSPSKQTVKQVITPINDKIKNPDYNFDNFNWVQK